MEVFVRLRHNKVILWPFCSDHYRNPLPSENQSKFWSAVPTNLKRGVSWVRYLGKGDFPVSEIHLLHPCWLPESQRQNWEKLLADKYLKTHLERGPPSLSSAAPVGKGCIGGKDPDIKSLLASNSWVGLQGGEKDQHKNSLLLLNVWLFVTKYVTKWPTGLCSCHSVAGPISERVTMICHIILLFKKLNSIVSTITWSKYRFSVHVVHTPDPEREAGDYWPPRPWGKSK